MGFLIPYCIMIGRLAAVSVVSAALCSAGLVLPAPCKCMDCRDNLCSWDSASDCWGAGCASDGGCASGGSAAASACKHHPDAKAGCYSTNDTYACDCGTNRTIVPGQCLGGGESPLEHWGFPCCAGLCLNMVEGTLPICGGCTNSTFLEFV